MYRDSLEVRYSASGSSPANIASLAMISALLILAIVIPSLLGFKYGNNCAGPDAARRLVPAGCGSILRAKVDIKPAESFPLVPSRPGPETRPGKEGAS